MQGSNRFSSCISQVLDRGVSICASVYGNLSIGIFRITESLAKASIKLLIKGRLSFLHNIDNLLEERHHCPELLLHLPGIVAL
jgi:hypothetical protein